MDKQKILEFKKYLVSRIRLNLDTLQVVRDNLLDSSNALDNLELCDKLNKVSEFLISLPVYIDIVNMAEQKGD